MRIPEDSAILELKRNFRHWKQFQADVKQSNLLWSCLLLCLTGKCDQEIEKGFTAYEIINPHADFWKSYFNRFPF